MKIETAQEIIACLPQGKTSFSYCKDRYAAFLLTEIIGEQCPVTVLSRSVFAKLLTRDLIKPLVDNSGYGVLCKHQLANAWSINTETFLLTLAIWGHKDNFRVQVSRPGVSLVLQLNFSNKHEAMFRKMLNPVENHRFSSSWHPILQRHRQDFFRETLAWARIDLDFATNEALIEELQTDWIRRVRDVLKYARRYSIGSNNQYLGTNAEGNWSLESYAGNIIFDYAPIWDEALLTAAIQFIYHELGIARIYLHTPDTGAIVKRIFSCAQPPRSLYSDLPKKFCFSQIDEAPEFLQRELSFRRIQKKLGGARWNYLNLGEQYANIAQTATQKLGRHVTLAA